MKHAAITGKARQKSSGRPKISVSILDQNRSRLLMASALGMFSLAMAGNAQACDAPSTQSFTGGSFGYTWANCQGTDGSKDNDAVDGDKVDLTTAGTYTAGSTLPYTVPAWAEGGGVIQGSSRGGDGYDDHFAGGGGSVSITNSASVNLTSDTDPGVLVGLISGESEGGDGAYDNGNNDTNGGSGGGGGVVEITNTGALSIESLKPGLGVDGIFASSTGGIGGNQNNGTGDQAGGGGGDGGIIIITNTGQMNLGSAASPLEGIGDDGGVFGINAYSSGNVGGNQNGAGGDGGPITITNGSQDSSDPSIGAISVYADAQASGGISAGSMGGIGVGSQDSSDNGGDGAAGGQISISTYADITVVGTGTIPELMGGISAVTRGGRGGGGWSSSTGGRGGDGSYAETFLTVQSGATISTQGDYLAGMIAVSQGGDGGDGMGGEKDSSGGHGGTGGSIRMNVYGAIETDGSYAYGLLGESIGGQGGNGGDDTAVVGTSGGGGYGGDAGGVGGYMTSGSSITTTGDFSAGVTLHSVGGGGGTGGDFTDVLGGGAGNGGNGGAGETATINNAGGTVATLGDHSYGILVQSIGGSGGTGGIADGLTLELGGDGGEGGGAGTASVQNTGAITTSGYSAHGIIAQSISGGGGAAGMAGGVLSIGGTGGDANFAGTAQVQNSGAIRTSGDAAIGIIAQSIGGGGGSGGGAAGIATVGGSGGGGGAGTHANVLLTGGSVTTQGEMSHAIMAQSIGGGGGNGGNVIDLSVGVPAVGVGGSGSAAGSGGWVCVTNENSGGDCPTVSGTPQAVTIATAGSGAVGILAQSVGGGGGNGGNATGGDAGLGSFQVGGGGGGGGYANTVNVAFQGLNLTTQGSHAAGIVAQSIGGGGGTGGSASSYSAGLGFTASVAVGGTGGSGGSSDKVTVHLTNSAIKTGQDGGDVTDAIGVLAQSISGGGGTGGSSIADALTAAVPTGEDVSLAMSVATAVGGSGGSSHTGGDVSLTLDGSTGVSTKGVSSHGLVAQSIGGGGGNGGSASSMASTAGTVDTISADIGVSVGGSGSGGGGGGTVTVDLKDTAWVATADDYANAVVVQSIGGGGGNGGVGSVNSKQYGSGFNLTATVGVGGSGGGGGAGGEANVQFENGTKVQTNGSGARGLLVQSIGGGGGTSQGVSVGLSGSASLPGGGEEEAAAEASDDEDLGEISAGVTVSVGRTGGGGGDGGTINVKTAGSISTSGGDADGVLAQSIGGGGGLGGSVASATPDDSEELDDEDSKYEFSVGVGGAGGTAAHGGVVTLTHAGQITTTGDWADGIVAQSIGGGGGTAGSSTISGSQATANIDVGVGGGGGAGGDGGTVSITFDSNNGTAGISTAGYSAHGVLLQSIGGGGGQGGDGSDQAAGKITVGGGIGGSGGPSGNGGSVSITGGSQILAATEGDDAYAVVAQSIGGGGGIGGAGSSTASEDEDSHSLEVSVGGSGGSAGDGGAVTLDFETQINTSGDRAFGILAQSIGGGGGVGGAGSSDSIASVAIGGNGTSSGKGGTVDLDLSGSIQTLGAGAHGIVAQSIGGGGGIAGDAAGGPLLLFGFLDPGDEHTSDDSGTVTVNFDGTIETDGNRAFGILAQSVGGGGGIIGKSGSVSVGNTAASTSGSSDNVTVTQSGTLTTSGVGSVGIFAQSQSTEVLGTVNVTVNGAVTGGTGIGGAGVYVADGVDNVLTINSGGSVTSGGSDAYAITYWSNLGQDANVLTVNNSGTITGNISLENEDSNNAGTVNNINGGTTVPAAKVSTASASSAAAPSGGTLVGASLYEANVVNGGTLVVGHSGGIDATRITGNLTQDIGGVLALTADFAGSRMDRLTVEGDAALDGKFAVNAISVLPDISLPFLTVGGTLDHSLSAQSALFDYAVTREGNELSVSATSAHFAEPGADLNDDQNNVAGHLQEIWDVGGGSFGALFGTLGNLADDDAGSYGSALSDMSPGVSGAAAAGSIATTQQHLDLLLSCPRFAAGTSVLTETECGWAQAGGQILDQKASGGISGFDTTTYSMQAGAQFEVSPDWFVGLAGGYDRSSIRGDDDRVNADGDILYAGVSLKHQNGPWLLSGAIAGSYGWYDNTRTIRIPGFAGLAEGDPDIYNLSARVRAAYTFTQDPYYVRPLVDLDLIYTHADGYRETGTGALDLLVDGAGQWSFHATPAVEIGTRVELNETTVMRAYAAAGVSFSTVDSWDTSARLAQAPAGIGGFDTEVPLADVVGRLTAGVDLANDNGFSVRAQYSGAFSDTYTSHGGSLRLSYKF